MYIIIASGAGYETTFSEQFKEGEGASDIPNFVASLFSALIQGSQPCVGFGQPFCS